MTGISSSFWKGRSVFVTGATGLLGTWLVRALVHRGAQVVALVRDRSGRRGSFRNEWPDGVVTVTGCVTDSELMANALTTYSIETVFHLAAQALIGVAEEDPANTLDVNVRGTWTVLEASRSTSQCQVLVASSGKAYGDTEADVHTEDLPLQGRHPYDVSKSCADLIATMYATAYGLPTGIVRSGNLFGGGDLNFSRTVPGAILATLRGEPFVIRSDGKAVRDYLYVEDAVDAYLLLAEHLAHDSSLRGQSFNFCEQQTFTVLEIAELVLRMVGRTDLHPVILGLSSAGHRPRRLSVEKASRVLRWRPRHGMEEGLRHSIDWYREYLNSLEGERLQTAVAS